MWLSGNGYNDLGLIESMLERVTFVIDETLIKTRNDDVAWLWIAMEPINKTVLGAYNSVLSY